jgi:hypothetical protein
MRWLLLASTLLAGLHLACQSDRPPLASDEPPATGTAGNAPSRGAGGSTPPLAPGGTAGTATGGGASGSAGTGGADATAVFQYDGSLLFAPVVVDKPQRVEISAPILPRTAAIYRPFPATLEGEQAMAHEAALLFDWLLPQCAPLYPMITLAPAGGAPLSAMQLATNYDQVGRCAYEQHTAKPYWIPRLVDDVDICGTEMGPGWRLITEADLASFSEADFQNVASTWNLHVAGGGGLGFFFSSLAIWVRANDGVIKAGTLTPGVTGSRVTPLAAGTVLTDHYEGELGLRCIRRTDLP